MKELKGFLLSVAFTVTFSQGTCLDPASQLRFSENFCICRTELHKLDLPINSGQCTFLVATAASWCPVLASDPGPLLCWDAAAPEGPGQPHFLFGLTPLLLWK